MLEGRQMSELQTPQYTKNAKRFKAEPRVCGNDACRDYKGTRTKLSQYNDDDYCAACLRNPDVDTSRPAVRRHNTGLYDLKLLRAVARKRGASYRQISLHCARLGKKISVNTLSQWGRGITLATKDDAITLTCVLNCTLEDLTGE